MALLAITACSRPRKPVLQLEAPEVRTWGALREVMHEGRVGPKVSLLDVVGPGLYAVGALAELAGEITVVDGKAYIARAAGQAADVMTPREPVAATLLTAATVPAWTEVMLSAAAANTNALDAAIEAAARNAGLDVERAFPFLIEGTVEATWHVLRGRSGGAGAGGHEAHMRDALTGKLNGSTATVVGFFSRHHQGVFTHMGQHSHLHVLTEDRKTMGHVDEISVPAGVRLKLPAR